MSAYSKGSVDRRQFQSESLKTTKQTVVEGKIKIGRRNQVDRDGHRGKGTAWRRACKEAICFLCPMAALSFRAIEKKSKDVPCPASSSRKKWFFGGSGQHLFTPFFLLGYGNNKKSKNSSYVTRRSKVNDLR